MAIEFLNLIKAPGAQFDGNVNIDGRINNNIYSTEDFIAIGYDNNPTYGITIGENINSNAPSCVAIGNGSKVHTDDQSPKVVIGTYNISDEETTNCSLIVGCGTADGNRKNALLVEKDTGKLYGLYSSSARDFSPYVLINQRSILSRSNFSIPTAQPVYQDPLYDLVTNVMFKSSNTEEEKITIFYFIDTLASHAADSLSQTNMAGRPLVIQTLSHHRPGDYLSPMGYNTDWSRIVGYEAENDAYGNARFFNRLLINRVYFRTATIGERIYKLDTLCLEFSLQDYFIQLFLTPLRNEWETPGNGQLMHYNITKTDYSGNVSIKSQTVSPAAG